MATVHDTPIVQKDEAEAPLYYRSPDLPACIVPWPHGGWIAWNWLKPSWDHVTDAEHEAIREGERAAFGIDAAPIPTD